MAHGEVADLLRAEIVTDEHRARGLQRIEEAQHVLHHLLGVIRRRVGRAIARPVAALIGGECAPAGRGHDRQLVAEAVPQAREAVAEDHRHPAALRGHVQRDAVAADPLVSEGLHASMMDKLSGSRHAQD